MGAKSAKSVILQSLCRVFCVYVLLVILGLVFIAPLVEYAWKSEFVALNGFFVLAAMLMGGVVASLHFDDYVRSLPVLLWAKAHWRLATMLLCVGLFVVEVAISYGAWFRAGWDVAHVTEVSNLPNDTFYFSICSNNLFIAGLFAIADAVLVTVGVKSLYWSLVVLSCFCVSLSIWLTSQVAFQWGGVRLGALFFVVAFILVGLSPWVMVPYSDTFGMLFVAGALFCWCKLRGPVRWLACSFIGVVGYAVKPTVIFALAACLFVSLMAERTISIGKVAKGVLSFTLGVFLALAVSLFVKAIPNVEVDASMEMGPSHFLMMGFNFEDGGAYSRDDWIYSESFTDPDERLAKQIELLKKRIKQEGPVGVIKLFVKKSFSNFGSGDFAWGCEGGFFKEVCGLNSSLKAFYGIPQATGDLANTSTCPWSSVAQAMWFFILTGTALLLIGIKRCPNQFLAAPIMLLMLSVFLLLFECRARYLILYSPVFVLVGTMGWLKMKTWVQTRI